MMIDGIRTEVEATVDREAPSKVHSKVAVFLNLTHIGSAMNYKGIAKGKMIELEEKLPYRI